MSVKSVVSQSLTVANDLWMSRLTVNSSSGLTNLEMTRLFTRLAGIGVVGTGLTTFPLLPLGLSLGRWVLSRSHALSLPQDSLVQF